MRGGDTVSLMRVGDGFGMAQDGDVVFCSIGDALRTPGSVGVLFGAAILVFFASKDSLSIAEAVDMVGFDFDDGEPAIEVGAKECCNCCRFKDGGERRDRVANKKKKKNVGSWRSEVKAR